MKIILFGNGNIGQKLLGCLIEEIPGYFSSNLINQILVVDKKISNTTEILSKKYNKVSFCKTDIFSADIDNIFKNHDWDIIINCLPFFCNIRIIEYAEKYKINYFDFSEDTVSIELIKKITNTNPDSYRKYFPCCGLAPGIINILGAHVLSFYEKPESLKLRVGALPLHSLNELHYAVNWSIDGLINEFTGTYHHKINNQNISKKLDIINNNVENIIIDGKEYEAIETSGGIGTMAENCNVPTLNYKTIRYRGHYKKMLDVVLNTYKKENNKQSLYFKLGDYFNNVAVPCEKDVVLILISCIGKKIYESIRNETIVYKEIKGSNKMKAIEQTTVIGLMGVLEMFIKGYFKENTERFIKQEMINWNDFIKTKSGNILNGI